MHAALEAIQNSLLSQWLTSEQWPVTATAKQILETLHFLAFELQIGAIVVISLRLLGLGSRVSIGALERPVFRIAWSASVFVLVTGVLQFVPIAAEVFYRPSFRAKMAVLLVALGGLVWLHAEDRILLRADRAARSDAPRRPAAARVRALRTIFYSASPSPASPWRRPAAS